MSPIAEIKLIGMLKAADGQELPKTNLPAIHYVKYPAGWISLPVIEIR